MSQLFNKNLLIFWFPAVVFGKFIGLRPMYTSGLFNDTVRRLDLQTTFSVKDVISD